MANDQQNNYNLVRSLTITRPYVGTHFVFNNQDFKVWKVKEIYVLEELDGLRNIELGKVLEVNDDETMDIKSYDGAIRLLEFDNPHLKKGDYLP